jgi:hypothetical protein
MRRKVFFCAVMLNRRDYCLILFSNTVTQFRHLSLAFVCVCGCNNISAFVLFIQINSHIIIVLAAEKGEGEKKGFVSMTFSLSLAFDSIQFIGISRTFPSLPEAERKRKHSFLKNSFNFMIKQEMKTQQQQ